MRRVAIAATALAVSCLILDRHGTSAQQASSLAEQCTNNLRPPSFVAPESTPVKPMWVASFPGSGSELFRNLVEAATGLPTDEVYNRDTDCQHNPVICKTHWPMKVGGSALKWGAVPEDRRDQFQQRAVVLLRNPAHAIPSLFNYKWEEQHHIRGHSQQGSEEDWIEWRDRRFDNTLAAWKKLLLTWANQVSYDAALFVPYEELTREETGPGLMGRMVDELTTGGASAVSQEQVPCLWYRVVQEKAAQKRTKRSYQPQFTIDQTRAMLQALEEVKTELAANVALVATLERYQDEIRLSLPVQVQ